MKKRLKFAFVIKIASYMKRCLNFPILLTIAVILCLSSCKSAKNTIADNDYGSTDEDIVAIVNTMQVHGERKKLIDEARSWLGTPYRYAYADKGVGTDCSGMVMKIYDEVTGLKLPRNSQKQADFCEKITAKDVVAGDLVFFATGKDPNRVSHVGIMLGDDSFVHASASKGVVISRMSSRYYIEHFIMYGRIPSFRADN